MCVYVCIHISVCVNMGYKKIMEGLLVKKNADREKVRVG